MSMHEIRRLRKQANDAYRRGDRNAQMIIQSEIMQLENKAEQAKVKREEYTFSAMNCIESYYDSIDLMGQKA